MLCPEFFDVFLNCIELEIPTNLGSAGAGGGGNNSPSLCFNVGIPWALLGTVTRPTNRFLSLELWPSLKSAPRRSETRTALLSLAPAAHHTPALLAHWSSQHSMQGNPASCPTGASPLRVHFCSAAMSEQQGVRSGSDPPSIAPSSLATSTRPLALHAPARPAPTNSNSLMSYGVALTPGVGACCPRTHSTVATGIRLRSATFPWPREPAVASGWWA